MSKCMQNAGRGRRPRGPTYARGTKRSLFENQELARQRTAHDVATPPPCRNLFRDAHFEIIQFCLCRQSSQFLVYWVRVHFLFIGSLSVFFQFHFRFSFVSFAFHFRVLHFVESWCQPYRRSSSHIVVRLWSVL
jgi:hypothetical protein